MGLVPPKDGDVKSIHQLCHPACDSVIYFIDPNICNVNYNSIDEAVSMIQFMGQGAPLPAKTDLKSAFRLLPIYPGHFDLLGTRFDGKYYLNKCLAFWFQAFLCSFLHWLHVVNKKSNKNIIHYLDEFLLLGKDNDSYCKYIMDTFHEVCAQLRVPIAKDKTVETTTCLTFLGYRNIFPVSREISIDQQGYM